MTEPELPDTVTEVARVVIVKTFDDDADGGEAIVTTYSEGLSLVDALGMLAFSTWATPSTYIDDEGEDR